MNNDKRNELTVDQFDSVIGKPEKIWGASNIAAALGCSIDKVRDLAVVEGVPIYKPLGTGYFAYRSELEHWLRTKPTSPAQGLEKSEVE